MDKVKNIIIIALSSIIMVLMLSKGCNPKQGSYIVKTQKTTIIDTVYAKDTIYKFKTIEKPVPVITYLDHEPLNLNECKYINVYSDSLLDSNLNIYYDVLTKGKLDAITMSYKLKVPLLIKETNTITNTEILTKQPKLSLYGGLELGGSKTSFNFSPFLGLTMKNKNIYYRYGALDNTHNVGVGITLLKSKK